MSDEGAGIGRDIFSDDDESVQDLHSEIDIQSKSLLVIQQARRHWTSPKFQEGVVTEVMVKVRSGKRLHKCVLIDITTDVDVRTI